MTDALNRFDRAVSLWSKQDPKVLQEYGPMPHEIEEDMDPALCPIDGDAPVVVVKKVRSKNV